MSQDAPPQTTETLPNRGASLALRVLGEDRPAAPESPWTLRKDPGTAAPLSEKAAPATHSSDLTAEEQSIGAGDEDNSADSPDCTTRMQLTPATLRQDETVAVFQGNDSDLGLEPPGVAEPEALVVPEQDSRGDAGPESSAAVGAADEPHAPGQPIPLLPSASSDPLSPGDVPSAEASSALEAQRAPLGTTAKPKERRRRLPHERGGRPRGPSRRGETEQDWNLSAGRRQAKPEMVCIREGMSWMIGVEVPEDLADRKCSVAQPSGELDPHEDFGDSGHPIYPLRDPLGAVTVRPAEEPGVPEYGFPEEAFRLFKIVGTHVARGRRVQRAGRGDFLAVFRRTVRPEVEGAEWIRILSDSESVRRVSPPAYLLRLTGESESIAFTDVTEGNRLEIPRGAPVVELVGSTFDDDLVDEFGPMFLGEPPRLRSHGAARPASFVVVEETTTAQKRPAWRSHGQDFESLRAEIAARRAGWFSVRCYDAQEDLIESLPFRLAVSLERVEIESRSRGGLPGPNGHEEAIVRIIHRDPSRLSPAAVTKAARMESAAWGTCARILPTPDGDRTRWRLEEGPGAVEFSVGVDRVWWAMAAETAAEDGLEWAAVPPRIRHDDFAPTSSTVLYVLLPRVRCTASVGFREEGALAMRNTKGSPIWSLPFRNLTDRKEMETKSPSLRLFVGRPESRSRYCVEVARITTSERTQRRNRRLDTAALSPARVVGVLTRLAQIERGGIRRALLRFRKENYSRALSRGWPGGEDFVRAALCVMAVLMDRHNVRGASVPRRWRERAHAARNAFPEISDAAEAFLSRALGIPS